MIRSGFILFVFFVAVGLSPALAQNIFNKKDSGGSDSAPVIFNKAVKKSPSSNNLQAKIKYKNAALNIQKKQLESLTMAKSLDEIHELGLKPTNAEELMFYAQASRAQSLSKVYKRREALMAHLQKQELKQQASLAAMQSAKKDAETPETKDAPKKSKGKSKLFVKSKDDEDAKPTKVFTGYR